MNIDTGRLDYELELLARELEEKEVTTNSLKLAKAAFLTVMNSELSYNRKLLIETFERIIKDLPLTELTNEPDDWEEVLTTDRTSRVFCHKRYPALIREDTIGPEGIVIKTRYIDGNQIRIIDVNKGIKNPYRGGIGYKIYENEYPITFPYYPPTNKDTIFVGNYNKNESGIFETVAVYSIRTKLGLRKINRYFAYIEGDYAEISLDEFKERVGKK